MITWILLPTSDAATSVSCQDSWPKSYRKRTNVLHIDVTARLESVTNYTKKFIFYIFSHRKLSDASNAEDNVVAEEKCLVLNDNPDEKEQNEQATEETTEQNGKVR